MKLFLENVCNIKNAEINIDGITVIAGHNNTGKSTVGKSLHLICKSFYNIDETIQKEKERSIVEVLRGIQSPFSFNNIGNYIESFDEKELKNSIIHLENISQEKIELYLNDYLESIRIREKKSFKKIASEKAQQIYHAINISNNDYFRGLANRILNRIFFSAINNINTKEESKISLKIKDKIPYILIKNNKVVGESRYNCFSDVIYIETPFAFDDMNMKLYRFIRELKNYYLMDQLLSSEEVSVSSEIRNVEKLGNILTKLNAVCPGEIVTKGQAINYRESENAEELPIQNISTGIKSFLILKTLLLQGQLKEKGILILDEPEVHVHPAWQLIYAELIVLLQKELNLHILLTTHSPYFIQAIEAYSKEHDIAKRCNYYLSDEEDGTFVFKNVTEDLNPIYEKFYTPLQFINDIEEKNA